MTFHIREGTADDVAALARLHVQTFNETHTVGRGGGPSYALRERQWREAFTVTDASWFCFVVESDGGDAANPSNGFYEAFGAARLYAPDGEFHGAYGWRDLSLLVGACHGTSTGRIS